MAMKKLPATDFRVVVHPVGWGITSVDQWRVRCEAVMAQIQRHVDNVERVEMTYTEPHVCEHCGARWTESSYNYNGGCCAEDEKWMTEWVATNLWQGRGNPIA